MFPEVVYYVCVRSSGSNEWLDFSTASGLGPGYALSFAKFNEEKGDLPAAYYLANPVIRVDRIIINVLEKG